MVTTVSNSLFRRLIDVFPPNKPYVRADFSREPMPKPVAEYLEQLLRFHLQQTIDAVSHGGTEWFAFDHPDVRAAQAAFVTALSRHQMIPASEWRDVLREACREAVSYLVRPASTLSNAVFAEEGDSATPKAIFDRLNFYGAYPYFREVISAYFDQKNVDRIDRDRLESLIRRIDRQMTADYGAEEWRRLLEPLFSVVRDIPELSGGIPVEVLQNYFEEKQANRLVERVKEVYSAPNVHFVGREELSVLFEEKPEQEAPVAMESVNHSRVEAGAPERERVVDSEGGQEPLWRRFENGGRPAKPRPEKQDAAASSGPEPLWKQYRATPGRNESETIPDLTALERVVLGERGIRNRDTFITHLFAGSREDYERTLRRLQPAPNWSSASQIIAQEVFLKHQVNIYSEPAVTFTESAEARYRT